MKKTRIKHFVLLFIVFPSFVGYYSIYFSFGDIEGNSKSIIVSGGEELPISTLPNNPLNLRDDLVYKPIESTLNISTISKTALDVPINATETVEYDIRTGKERLLNKSITASSSLFSTVEPYEGALPSDYAIEVIQDEESGGLKASYVWPPDDRQKITSVTEYPWRTITKLYIQTQESTYYIGSGAIIDDFHVLTCGHCVYIHDEGGWAA